MLARSLFLSAVLARGAFGVEYLSHCPGKTHPVRTADPQRPWACVISVDRSNDGLECPSGYASVATSDRLEPFKCALINVHLQMPRGICPPGHRPVPTADPTRSYECEKIGVNFLSGPGCPRGSHPVATPGALTPFHCAADSPTQDSEPSASTLGKAPLLPGAPAKIKCPRGTVKVPTENPFVPFQCRPPSERLEPLRADSYARYRIHDQLHFDYPRHWHLTDAWKDDPSSVYIEMGSSSEGKPVSLSITRQRKASKAYEDMESVIWREKNWRGAVEERKVVAGLPARVLTVAEDSRTAFIEVRDGYYSLSYSAPADLYGNFLPAFSRLLESFSVPSSPGGLR